MHFSPSPGFVTLQFLIFIHISIEVGMGVMLLAQAKTNRVHGAAKCCFVVTQTSIPVVSASEPWGASVEGVPWVS